MFRVPPLAISVKKEITLLVAGALLVLLSGFIAFYSENSALVPFIWLFAIMSFGAFFYSHRKPRPNTYCRKDFLTALALFLSFTSCYLVFIQIFPSQTHIQFTSATGA